MEREIASLIASILVAFITGAFALTGTIISNLITHSKTIYRIEQLEKKQDKHNSLIERMYGCEKAVSILDEKQKVIIEDIEDLKRGLANDGR